VRHVLFVCLFSHFVLFGLTHAWLVNSVVPISVSTLLGCDVITTCQRRHSLVTQRRAHLWPHPWNFADLSNLSTDAVARDCPQSVLMEEGGIRRSGPKQPSIRRASVWSSH
jgi:hypothetical protein